MFAFMSWRLRLSRWVASGVVLLAGMMPTLAQAELSCSGKINAVLLYNDGSVLVGASWRNDYVKLCNTQDGAVPSEVCLGWYAAALKARAENTTVGVHYYGTPAASCITLPTYNNTPAPAYFGVFN
jgi:hypothetical protein